MKDDMNIIQEKDATIAALEAEVQRLRALLRKQSKAAAWIEQDLASCFAEAATQRDAARKQLNAMT